MIGARPTASKLRSFLKALSGGRPFVMRSYSFAASDASSVDTYPRDAWSTAIAEVPLEKEYRNSVSLIGRLGKDLELREVGSTVVAKGSLAVQVSKERTDWFTFEIWDALAQQAQAALHKGSLVQVVGQLRADPWTDPQGNKRILHKVRCSHIYRVTTSASSHLLSGDSEDMRGYSDGHTREYPQQPQQAPPLGPDGRISLEGLDIPPIDCGTDGTENLWIRLFRSPRDFWDNRMKKTNPQAPDFTLRDRSLGTKPDALWLEGRYPNPAWVDQALPFFDQIAEEHSYYGDHASMAMQGFSEVGGGQVEKGPLPMDKDGQIDYQQLGIPDRGSGENAMAELWIHLFRQPHDFVDIRSSKNNPKAPDFKLKDAKAPKPNALWLDGRGVPQWVVSAWPYFDEICQYSQ